MSMFHPSQVAMISMGTLTFIKPAINKLRSTGLKSKVLQIPMEDAVGKSSYTKEVKKEIFSNVYDEFSSWHKDLFFYLCMEESSIWEMVFGDYYKIILILKQLFLKAYPQKWMLFKLPDFLTV